jgi:hypothetical protein
MKELHGFLLWKAAARRARFEDGTRLAANGDQAAAVA